MPLTISTLTSGASTAVSSQASASITPAQNRLILAAVTGNVGEGPPSAPTAAGNGLTWVSVGTVTFNTDLYRLTLFRAMGAAPTAGAVTFTLGESQSAVTWWVGDIHGTDVTGANGAGAVVQAVTNSAAGGSTSLTMTLAAFAASTNGTLVVIALTANNDVTPGAGFTQVFDGGQTSSRLFIGFKDSSDTSADGTFAATAAGGVAAEIALGSASASTIDGGGAFPGGPGILGEDT